MIGSNYRMTDVAECNYGHEDLFREKAIVQPLLDFW